MKWKCNNCSKKTKLVYIDIIQEEKKICMECEKLVNTCRNCWDNDFINWITFCRKCVANIKLIWWIRMDIILWKFPWKTK